MSLWEIQCVNRTSVLFVQSCNKASMACGENGKWAENIAGQITKCTALFVRAMRTCQSITTWPLTNVQIKHRSILVQNYFISTISCEMLILFGMFEWGLTTSKHGEHFYYFGQNADALYTSVEVFLLHFV